jgi:hypothetical protein
MYSETLSFLDCFIGHTVELDIQEPSTTYIYNNFQWYVDNNQLVLTDGNEHDCRTYIPIEEINDVENLCEDMYQTVVTIRCKQYVYSVCCFESEPIPPVCDKCKKEFKEYEHTWEVNQTAGFGTKRDGDDVSIKICDSCFEKLFRDVLPSTEEDGEYDE